MLSLMQNFLKKYDLIPHRPKRLPLREVLPQSTLHWVSAILLCALSLAYLGVWMQSNHDYLFDPLLQNDDARQHIFHFHQYGPEKTLVDDPIAEEKRAMAPPGIIILYKIFVPITGLFVAAKIVQGICFLVVLLAGVIVMTSRRGGLALGVVLVFFTLHTPNLPGLMAGGMARNFAFPFLALWTAGAITKNEWVRYSAILLGAFFYPTIMALTIAAEGLFNFRDSIRFYSNPLRARLIRYALLVCGCVIIVSPFAFVDRGYGHVFGYSQASQMPIFGPQGRSRIFPLKPVAHEIYQAVLSPMEAHGDPGIAKFQQDYKKLLSLIVGIPHHSTWPFFGAIFLVGFLFLMLWRFSPPARAALALLLASVILVYAARMVILQLYLPERYYEFGGPFVFILLAISCIAVLGPKGDSIKKYFWQNIFAFGLILGIWTFVGSGIYPNYPGLVMNINQRDHAELYAYVKALPITDRIAAWPMDGVGIPLWTGRAIMESRETLFSFFDEAWQKKKIRVEETIDALYATDRETVVSYTDKYKVTHFLLNKFRYSSEFIESKNLIKYEPFKSYTNTLLDGVDPNDLVLGDLPEEAVLFQEGPLRLVDVEVLKRVWGFSRF
jgi:hypothetical protein